MDIALDAVLEIFTWVGLGGALMLGIAMIAVWAADGTWLPADAIVDRDGGDPVVRWFDGDGDVNSARLTEAEASVLGDAESTRIWYRFGWHDRMRLTRRSPVLRRLGWLAIGLATLAVLSTVVSWVLLFARG